MASDRSAPVSGTPEMSPKAKVAIAGPDDIAPGPTMCKLMKEGAA